MPKFIKFFEELGIKDVPQVGGKNASLGEMYQKLTKQGVNIPNGFATTAEGYRFFFEKTGLKKQIHAILDGLDTHKVVDLDNRAKKVRAAIIAAKYPDVLKKEIIIAYRKLSEFN